MQMFHRRFTYATRVLLCESNREKLENMEIKPHTLLIACFVSYYTKRVQRENGAKLPYPLQSCWLLTFVSYEKFRALFHVEGVQFFVKSGTYSDEC